MTTLEPRAPFTQEELDKLYPKNLQLELVQILLRHGERSPVSTRFQNAGLAPYWPYCNAAKRLSSVAMTKTDWSQWSELQWRRRLERFGPNDEPTIASGPSGDVDGVCNLGELTDKGRETTLALGERLRHLYVNQLKFMPALISDADMIYLRATPLPRALESVQQAFWGMYPATARTQSFPPPTIITRTPADETLYPNDANCRRFNQLSRAFAQRTADRWNETDEMAYLNKLMSKWMPESSPKVAVDSHPRLSGIMDTINSTLAHGPETRLPSSFYDRKLRDIVDKIGVEEWFSGYTESQEYRTLGIGSLVGDIVERMTGFIEGTGLTVTEVGGHDGQLGTGRGGEQSIRFAMSGCHDTTLAAVLSSLGAFDNEKWPPYTSHLAVELFRKPDEINIVSGPNPTSVTQHQAQATKPGFLASMLGLSSAPSKAFNSLVSGSVPSGGIGRRPTMELSDSELNKLKGHYVRIRYNDRVMQVPGCKKPGNHLEGDETFCTLEAFKKIVDKYTPKNWKQECGWHMDGEAFPKDQGQAAGYE